MPKSASVIAVFCSKVLHILYFTFLWQHYEHDLFIKSYLPITVLLLPFSFFFMTLFWSCQVVICYHNFNAGTILPLSFSLLNILPSLLKKFNTLFWTILLIENVSKTTRKTSLRIQGLFWHSIWQSRSWILHQVLSISTHNPVNLHIASVTAEETNPGPESCNPESLKKGPIPITKPGGIWARRPALPSSLPQPCKPPPFGCQPSHQSVRRLLSTGRRGAWGRRTPRQQQREGRH